jgi:hypothetical protein
VGAGDNTQDATSAPTTSSTVDRIGAFFGYDGADALVPKAAYDAMLHRVRSLESALGQANRDIRTHTTTIGEQQTIIGHLTAQLQSKEALLQAAEQREHVYMQRERDLIAKEEAVERILERQQRKGLRKLRGLPNNSSAFEISNTVADDSPAFETASAPQSSQGEPSSIGNFAGGSRLRHHGGPGSNPTASSTPIGVLGLFQQHTASQQTSSGTGGLFPRIHGATVSNAQSQMERPPRSQTSLS